MLIRKIFRLWALFWFVLVFLLLYPFFVLFIQRKQWHRYGHFLNKIWAHVVFAACLLPTKVESRLKREKGKAYIYCANHSSYMDIPSLCYGLPGHFVFVGKASLAKVPLFGYMFRGLYISVDRESRKSRYNTMIECGKAIDENISIGIFPEGTIPKNGTYHMIPFKEGAFRMAIEKQVPIVPVTIPFNWIILPDDGKVMPRRHLMKMIIHEPIETRGMNLDQIKELSDRTFNIIQEELIRQNKR